MLFYTYVVRMGSEHENPGRFALDRKKKPFEKTIIFFSDKQFVQKINAICIKRLYFLYKIAVALRMECVDLSIGKCFFRIYGNIVALRMECVDLSFAKYPTLEHLLCRTPYGVRGFKWLIYGFFSKKRRRTPYGVRGFKYIKRKTENFSTTASHSVWSAWI